MMKPNFELLPFTLLARRYARYSVRLISLLVQLNIVEGSEFPRRIRIAVIDTGVDFNHAGIIEAKEQGRMKEDWCQSWVGGDSKDQDEGLHGTNCAYLLHKAAPEADIYVAKVFNHNALRFYEAENIAKQIGMDYHHLADSYRRAHSRQAEMTWSSRHKS